VSAAQSLGWNSVVYNKYNAKKVIESIFNSWFFMFGFV
jgi:hypothetical protein